MDNLDDDVGQENSDNIKEKTINHVKSSRKAFSKLAVELTDNELKSPGVQKMLLAEISQLESTMTKLENFEVKFHEADKNRAVLLEKEKTYIFTEILYSLGLTGGALLIGLTPSLKSNNWIICIIGAVFMISAIVAKVIKK